MYTKTINEAEFCAAHARGLKDAELANQFGISLSTVKRRKRELGLGSNCAHNNRGLLAQRMVAEYLAGEGMSTEVPASHQAPADLLVNGYRVEVKLGYRRSAAVQFRLPEQRNSFQGQYQYHKDYRKDTDYLALAVLNDAEDALEYLYLLPASELQPTITLHPEQPFCRYQQYLFNLVPLRVACAAA
ncbi:hypothetical protein [Deinococcus radiophilus]|uniref:Uncharacterized protein n=1 Tax=Deinococcus radiophilus TaxID=32062 RepID=A0A3S0JL02_9DEIO|nr:hypothetical protein [Deinococcus radiophilus]RTR23435.1 hypothetical protein EJ104_12505 [Deinococcus radiophilus]UFA50343.1 hypothetical protein LMT64_10840 [Deinococcus radiophilus]